MNYNVKKPCTNCPFKVGDDVVRLTMGRAEEIGGMMLSSHGGDFTCHNTLDKDERDQSHCAGAIAFALKNGNMTQMMRISQRLRMFDPEEFAKGIDPDSIVNNWWDLSYEEKEEGDV